MEYYIIVACVALPICITMFAYTRKRNFDTLNERETLSYSLQHDDEFYSVKRSKSALKKEKSNNRKSVQFNEVVLEVFDLINEDEDVITHKPSIVKSSLKKEKMYVPVRYSNTSFPKAVINEYNGEIIKFNEETKEETKQSKDTTEYPEILIIKHDEKETCEVLSPHEVSNNTLLPEQNNIAETVITSKANLETNNNLINNTNITTQKSNTLPRRARPSYKGHRRQSSVRLKCIY